MSLGIHDRSVLYAYLRRHTGNEDSAAGTIDTEDLELECGIANGNTAITR